jgi:hypothetical protein
MDLTADIGVVHHLGQSICRGPKIFSFFETGVVPGWLMVRRHIGLEIDESRTPWPKSSNRHVLPFL